MTRWLMHPGIAASLCVRLEPVRGRLTEYRPLCGPTNVALDRAFVVFQIRDLAEELRPLAIHLIAGWVWNRVRSERRPRLLIIDEAWSLLRYPKVERSSRQWLAGSEILPRAGHHRAEGRRFR